MIASPLVSQLVQVLTCQDSLSYWEACTPHCHYQTIALVTRLYTSMTGILASVLHPATTRQGHGVTLCSAGVDDDRKRPRTFSSEVKWVPVRQQQLEPTQDARNVADLIQLVRQILSTFVPEGVLRPLEQFCLTELGYEGPLSPLDLASSETPLFALMYASPDHLVALLKPLNSITINMSSRHTNTIQHLHHSLFFNFVYFVEAQCDDCTCFFEPILQVMGSLGEQVKVSNAFMKVVGRVLIGPEEEEEEEEEEGGEGGGGRKRDRQKLLDFIQKGGASVILDCILNSCSQSRSLLSGKVVPMNLSSLGKKDVVKPFKEGSNLVNFLPLSSIKIFPHRSGSSVRDLQNVSLGDQLTRSSAVHHIFKQSEEWMVVTLTLPYPILLYAVQVRARVITV